MAAAIDTLCSQAYGEYLAGTGERRELGRHLSRTIFILYLIAIPIAIVWWFTEPLLLLVGQDPEIARLSARFTRFLIPSLVPFVLSETVKRFLMSQGIMRAQMLIIGFVAPFHCLLLWVFVISDYRIGDDGVGAPICLTLSHTLIAVLLCLYTKYVKGGDSYIGWEWGQVLNSRKLWNIASLGFSGVLMTCSEWWAWEVVALAAGLISPIYLAAQTVVLNCTVITYTIPLGFAIASSTRIGNALGAQEAHRGRIAAWAAFGAGAFIAVLNSSFLLLGRNTLGRLFSDDEEVVEVVRQILPLAATFQVADVIGCIAGGVLRGAGRPEIGAYLNLLGYYVMGIPIGLALCFSLDYKLFGLWVGLTVALFLVAIVELVLIWRLDWAKEAENARNRSLLSPSSPLPQSNLE
ncbi:mate-domain-containing protein [Chytriomyces sp. MP71]|nr:mate-domain-containing protein [Chytriomyces sp. MP71]